MGNSSCYKICVNSTERSWIKNSGTKSEDEILSQNILVNKNDSISNDKSSKYEEKMKKSYN